MITLRGARFSREAWATGLGRYSVPEGAWLLLEEPRRVSLAAVAQLSPEAATSARGRLFCRKEELRWVCVGEDVVQATWAGEGEGPGWLEPLALDESLAWEPEHLVVLRGVERIDLGGRLDPTEGILCLAAQRARRDDGTIAWERLIELVVGETSERPR